MNMRNFVSVVMAIIVLLTSMTACGKSSDENSISAVDTYMEIAQEFITKGDYDSAIDILTKGIDATGSENLSNLLEDVLLLQASSNSNSMQSETTDSAANETSSSIDTDIDYYDYVDLWSTDSISLINGGIAMDIWFEYGTMVIDITIQGPAPDSYIDRIIHEISPKELVSRTITAQFTDVLEMNSGTLVMEFADNSIEITFSDIDGADKTTPIWNYCDKTLVLIRNEDAFDALCPDIPDEPPETTPTYNTSKASGILAQAGLTEQEFRNICTYIGSAYDQNNAYAYAAGQEYYAQHSEESWRISNRTEDWNDYVLYGKEPEYYKDEIKQSNSLDDFLNRTIYGPKGASILEDQSIEIFKEMREYPAQYVNQPFLLKHINVESQYGDTYFDENYILYGVTTVVDDYRDDVNNPNILRGYNYDMYVIFLGINDSNNLVFALLSVDKSDTR